MAEHEIDATVGERQGARIGGDASERMAEATAQEAVAPTELATGDLQHGHVDIDGKNSCMCEATRERGSSMAGAGAEIEYDSRGERKIFESCQ